MTRITPVDGGHPDSRGTRHPAVDPAVAENAAPVRHPARSGPRLLAWLDAAARLGGPIWFERHLTTHLDILAPTRVGAMA